MDDDAVMDAGADDGPAYVLADQLHRLRDEDLDIDHEVLLDALDAGEQRACITRAVDAVAATPYAVQDPDIYGLLASCIKYVAILSPEQCHALIDTVTSGMDAVVAELADADAEALAEPLERYAFLLQWLVANVEKHKSAFRDVGNVPQQRGGNARRGPREAWTWAASIPIVLTTFARTLRGVSERLWSSTSLRDTFVAQCIVRPVLLLQENEAYMKQPVIKQGIFRVVCLAVKQHGQAFHVQTSIQQSLQYYEHLAEPMAELLALLRVEFDVERLGEDVLRDLAQKSFTSLDSKSPRSYGRFLVRMAELSPRSVLKQMSLLQKHLDSESYPMRNAMIEVQGLLIRELGTVDAELGEGDDGARQRELELFFERLFERFLDLTTFVRTKTIQVCASLCDAPLKIAPQRLQMTSLAVRALEDKSSNVRRNAIALLIKLILTHPYGAVDGGELAEEQWTQRLAAVNAELERAERVLEFPERPTDTPSADTAAQGSTSRRRGRRSELDLDALAASQSSMTHADQEALTKLRLMKTYHEDALAFMRLLAQAIPTLIQLLASTNKAEVLESMEFFRVAYEYCIRGASDGVCSMIHLVWAKDNALVMEDGSQLKGVRSRVIDVYRALYFDEYPYLSRAENMTRIARNMIERTFGATLAELTSLEQLLSLMHAEGLVDRAVVEKLWDVYASERPIARAQRRGAIMVLSMLAKAERVIVADKIDVLLRIGLGPLGAHDLTLAKHTCVALQRVSGSAKKVKGALSDANVRYPMHHPMFARLRAVVLSAGGGDMAWFSLCEHAIQALYLLGEQPDALAGDIVHALTIEALGEHNGTPPQDAAFRVAQLLFVVGHVALKQIVYLELVEREFKRRKALQEADQGPKRTSELDQVADNAEDDIGDMIAFVRERELLYGPQSLLALFGPLVAHICTNPRAYTDEHVRRAAALTLGKFMCVSGEYCEAHLATLLHLLRSSEDAVVRANAVIGLGDVAVCFGTLVDENSEQLYAGLGDADLAVKKNTLMVLTHLILNGMIKVKGQLGEMAKCLEDDEPRVSDLAKLFFSELAQKENAVYNNLPDIISHLSSGEHAVDEATFANTMRFIFTFIDKERQAENVIEKLCQRFRLTTEERQWRDIAYCLSLLPYRSERSIKKLVDGLPYYQDKLYHQDVYKRFAEILAKMHQGKTSAQAKAGDTDLREFEDILAQAAAHGTQEQEDEDAAAAHVARLEKRRSRTRQATARPTQAQRKR